MAATVIEHLERLVPMTADDAELSDAHLVVEDGRIAAVGTGPVAMDHPGAAHEDGRGLIAIPGLINTHHHFFQTLTRALPPAQNVRILDWMAANYPYWARIDEEAVLVTAEVAIAELMLSGCTTSSDHLYAFPRGCDPLAMLGAEVEAAARLGIRIQVTRGAVDVSLEAGGSPPVELVEDTDSVLASMEAAISRFHDPLPGAMVRVGLAPNSMTIASERLMRESMELAKARGVTRHTHVAEVVEEEAYCLERYGRRPLQRLADLGWVDRDVWLAHVVHVNDEEIEMLARSGAGVAHCPVSNMRLASGAAPVLDMLERGVDVGIGVDGSASNDFGNLLAEARAAMLLSRLREQTRLMTARQALRIATVGGAQTLKRDDIGTLEVGRQADVAFFRLSGVASAGFEHDPVAALVLGIVPQVDHLMVQGRFVVRDQHLVYADEQSLVARHRSVVSRIVR